jgi:diguanylate cyclase (GGDEF)-like protein/PAS domain S-box-containing protein
VSSVDKSLGTSRVPARRRLASMVFVGAIACVVAIAIWSSGALDTLDRAYLDLQTRLLQRELSSEIVIVEIDAHTLKQLGQWPFPRSYHAEVLRKLERAGARTIFLDIDFSARSQPGQDAALAQAIRALPRDTQLILPAFWQPTSNDATSLLLSEPLPEFRSHAQLGLVNLVPGSDGLVREVGSFGELPADAMPVWRVLMSSVGTDSDPLQVDYRIAPASFSRVSYVDVLKDRFNVSVRDKIVFVGATALELGDMVAVPVHRALPGVIVQALAFESARAAALAHASTPATLSALVAWAALCALLLGHRRWRRSPLITLGLVAAALALVFVGYSSMNVVIPVSPFIIATVLVLTGSLLASLSVESWRSWWAVRRTREQDALLRQVVDHSSDAIITLDDRLFVRTVNRKACEILGKAESLLIGQAIAHCAPPLLAALHSVRTRAATEVWLQQPGTAGIAVEISAAQLTWEQQQITTLTLRDVTVQRVREAELRHLALHDALTGLPNRVAIGKRLEEALEQRRGDEIVALMMLDLDGFKEVNDTLGHSTGDELMRELGSRLAHLATNDRHIARLGGDEFAVLWGVKSADQIGELAQQLLMMIEEPIVIKGIPVSLGTSIGIAMCPDHAEDAESLLKRADIALYAAKRKHSRVEFYEIGNDTNSPRRLEMLTLLRAAVGKGELFLEYQPKVSMVSGEPIEVEALCRWQSPTFGRVVPGEFIALAEASDVIKPLTEWTIHKALSDCRAWRDRGVDLRVAVNLSARHLQDAQLPKWLEATFVATNTRADWLEVEITESAIMTDPDRASKILRALQELGVLISIDDFGTGYSSLAYLRTLAVDRLKLDRSFISGMDGDSKDQVIVESTIKLAHGLELAVVAEGIENERQYELLKKFGCDLGQGYWIAKPMPVGKLVEWYRKRASSADPVMSPTIEQDWVSTVAR